MATKLTPYERDVLRLRLGLDSGEDKTVREIAFTRVQNVTLHQGLLHRLMRRLQAARRAVACGRRRRAGLGRRVRETGGAGLSLLLLLLLPLLVVAVVVQAV